MVVGRDNLTRMHGRAHICFHRRNACLQYAGKLKSKLRQSSAGRSTALETEREYYYGLLMWSSSRGLRDR